jgi:hypothetical protein
MIGSYVLQPAALGAAATVQSPQPSRLGLKVGMTTGHWGETCTGLCSTSLPKFVTRMAEPPHLRVPKHMAPDLDLCSQTVFQSFKTFQTAGYVQGQCSCAVRCVFAPRSNSRQSAKLTGEEAKCFLLLHFRTARSMASLGTSRPLPPSPRHCVSVLGPAQTQATYSVLRRLHYLDLRSRGRAEGRRHEKLALCSTPAID